MLGSFKIKLVGTFLALSVVPLAAAFWGFSAVAERSVISGVDDRLEAGLNAALAAFEDERQSAEAAATRLGQDPDFQRALAERDRAAIQAMLPESPPLRIETADGFSVGQVPRSAAETTVSLVGPGDSTSTIIAAVPLTTELADRLHTRSGLTAPDELIFVDEGRRVGAASQAEITGSTPLQPGRVETAEIGDRDYRAIGSRLEPKSPAMLAAVTPSSVIASEKQSVLGRLLIGLIGSLLLIACVAYLAGRSIVGALGRLADAAHSIAAGRLEERVSVRGRDEFAQLGRAFNEMAAQLEGRLEDLEDERRRLREANARFGDALASSLDPEQLRRIIVESAVEATQADGGVVIAEDGSYVETGDVGTGGERLEFDLTSGRRSFGRLVLVGPHFDDEERMMAAALAGQAVIALENARLHRMVERQALVDGLTGLANRRQAEDTLSAQLARVGRGGGSVALVFADLDDFKNVNDGWGHPAGDVVLCEFAAVLRESAREMDLAARWGGEEFAVILPDTDADGAVAYAERAREALLERTLLTPAGTPLHLTASFGVATFPPASNQRELVAQADGALYDAKRGGKNRVARAAGVEQAG